MGHMRRILLCLAVCLLPVLAGPPMTRITVEVTNTEGKGVDRASVIVRFIHGHSVFKLGRGTKTSWEMKTNEEGRVSIPPLPQGTLLIQVIAKNYQTFGKNFDIDDPEKTVQIKLNPPQPQYSAHEK